MTAVPGNHPFPSAGELFAERYRIVRPIGEGGFSRVYAARQEHLDREVAIKVLSPSMSTRSSAREIVERRFYREAQLLSRLSGPNTITVFDYGRTSSGLLFMVTELIPGQDLSDMLKSEGALPVARAQRILTQILLGLREAHSHGFLHRDVKPSNIMIFDEVGSRDRAKLLDFGIAKTVSTHSADETALTMAGLVIGTPRYMSPEQALGQPVTRSSDLFSTGLVAWEMLVGYSPFRGLDFAQIQQRLSNERIHLPSTIDAPIELAAIIDRMLEVDPEARFQTAGEPLEELGISDVAVQEQSSSVPQPSNVLTFPMNLDSSGTTVVDTLIDSSSGRTRKMTILESTTDPRVPVEISEAASGLVNEESAEPKTTRKPARNARSESAGDATTVQGSDTKQSSPVRWVLLLGILGLVAFLVYAFSQSGGPAEEPAPSPESPVVDVAVDLVRVSIRHGEVEAKIAAKDLEDDGSTLMEFDENTEMEEPEILVEPDGADPVETNETGEPQPQVEEETGTREVQKPKDNKSETKTSKPEIKRPQPSSKPSDFTVTPIDDL